MQITIWKWFVLRIVTWSDNCLRISLFSFVSWYINLCRLFNAKAILWEEKYWYNWTYSWEDKGVHTFSKDICPKVNVIARPEFELAYNDSAVHCFNHYTMRTHPSGLVLLVSWNNIIAGKLFVLLKNSWNHTTECKWFVLDRNTWYSVTVQMDVY